MTRPIELANEGDFIERYQSGVSLQELSAALGCSRGALRRILLKRGVPVRDGSEAMRKRWVGVKARGETGRLLASAWHAADARNEEVERRALSMYRSDLTSQRDIARRLGISHSTVGGILRKNGIRWQSHGERRARSIVGGFNTATVCRIEPYLARELSERGLDYVHQCAIGTRNVDFGFPQTRIAVEIVRRHWGDAKSLRRERLEQIFRAGWRLCVVYDPTKRGIDVARCADQLVAFMDEVRRQPSAGGQYWMIGGDGERVPEARVQLHHFARVPRP